MSGLLLRYASGAGSDAFADLPHDLREDLARVAVRGPAGLLVEHAEPCIDGSSGGSTGDCGGESPPRTSCRRSTWPPITALSTSAS